MVKDFPKQTGGIWSITFEPSEALSMMRARSSRVDAAFGPAFTGWMELGVP